MSDFTNERIIELASEGEKMLQSVMDALRQRGEFDEVHDDVVRCAAKFDLIRMHAESYAANENSYGIEAEVEHGTN